MIRPCAVLSLMSVVWISMPDSTCGFTPQTLQGDESNSVASLLGKKLLPIKLEGPQRQRLEENLEEARRQFEQQPENVDNLIWLGRRLAYLWRYHDAIEVYTQGVRTFPDEPRLYRHRGHRWITVREFDKAIEDFNRAVTLIKNTEDSVEPDGQPNAQGIPTSTLFTNIYYHLGLAHYLQGNFEASHGHFQKCFELADNDDMRVAALDWIYMSLRRAGKHDEAKLAIQHVHEDMNIIENFAYHRRLLMYQGKIPVAQLMDSQREDADRDLDLATYGYAVGNWHLINGREQTAREVFETVIQGPYWAAFGYIAAEAELARWDRMP